ncbi:stonustoxin subunit beta-like [Morone saxatilis]|uniref:stonustoxin subunit beta-like n=1 Tax=Morone saxatilis TaxID=34816 RepID=UPI0015E21CEA|nr:stonustoxin subunit beta-like [Morone saxatilis]
MSPRLGVSVNLSERSCEALSSVLSSQSSSLRELDLSDNNLQDSGVKLLSVGLKSPHCRLETLRLSGCQVTEKGCAALASALRYSSHLRELDLNYNHLGHSGNKMLSAGLEDSNVRLDTLSMDYDGAQRLKPGLKKYACELSLNPNTASRFLKLSDNNRKVTWLRKEQAYLDNTERFDYWKQLLCKNSLTGRCYWEVAWKGRVHIAVTYRGITRKGEGFNSKFGANDQSWCLFCSDKRYSVWHNNKATNIPFPSSSASNKVAVYVDQPAGTLSFHDVSFDTPIHLHTFNTTFTELLYPAFGILKCSSSVSLC